ncbi:uncharacterized protein J3D65DRAFT_642003 [Phyllosticta citribraziliensis]|uniref:Secreted protein n=1 Tax=Phyllosticta citribraziliensis TaxID=989973 RepID=A0ABR1L6K4_9PEZI
MMHTAVHLALVLHVLCTCPIRLQVSLLRAKHHAGVVKHLVQCHKHKASISWILVFCLFLTLRHQLACFP